MKCAVITPVGPNHSQLFEQCKASVQEAISVSKGPFSKIEHLPFNDKNGTSGRSFARNSTVVDAQAKGFEWIYFLDADDLILSDAFDTIKDVVNKYDGIWGAIYELKKNTDYPRLRKKQNISVETVKDIFEVGRFHSLQMGHFVKTKVAAKNPFDIQMDAGEDFDYYFRVWYHHNCIKLKFPLFINRRQMHSCGPRAATATEWKKNVSKVFKKYADQYGIVWKQ